MAPDAGFAIESCWQKTGIGGDASCPELQKHIHCRNCPTHAGAASLLLNRAPPADYLEEWTRHVAQGNAASDRTPGAAEARAANAAATLSVMIFRIAGEWLALPTHLLEEVAEMRPVHSLPHRRSGVVLGVANIHGGLLICVSLAVLLGLAPEVQQRERRMEAKRRMLVIGHEAGRFVFPADEVQGIQRYRPDSLRPAPATVVRAASSYTRHVLSWQDRNIGYLDADLLLDGLNRSVA
jgi:chemotaxis-related protein WspD